MLKKENTMYTLVFKLVKQCKLENNSSFFLCRIREVLELYYFSVNLQQKNIKAIIMSDSQH